jgi:hypothetical protein
MAELVQIRGSRYSYRFARGAAKDRQLPPSPEAKNNLRHRLLHLPENINDRYTLDNPRFVEGYVHLKFHLLLQFRPGDGKECVAFFQDADALHRFHETTEVGERLIRVATSVNTHDLLSLRWRHAVSEVSSSNSDQEMVLISCIKSVQLPERVIPSFVWFERTDRLDYVLRHSTYFSSRRGRVVFLRAVGDRETGVACGDVSGLLHDSVSEEIESATHVVECVATDQRNMLGDFFRPDKIKRALRGVSIVLAPDFVWVGVEEASASKLQILDVLRGPV